MKQVLTTLLHLQVRLHLAKLQAISILYIFVLYVFCTSCINPLKPATGKNFYAQGMEKTFHIPIGNDCMMLIDSSYWNLQENNGNIEIKALYKPNSLISMSIKVWYSDIYVRDKLRFIGNRIQSLKIIYQKPQIIATDTSNLLGIRKSVSLLYSIIDENKPILVFETTTPEDEYYREHISIKIKYQLNKYDANKSKRLLDSIKEVLPSIRKR